MFAVPICYVVSDLFALVFAVEQAATFSHGDTRAGSG